MADIKFFTTKESEWADMTFYAGGARLAKIQNVSYGVEQDKEAVYGEGDEPLFIQSGNRKYNADIEVLKGALDDLNAAALAAGGRDLLDLELDIVVNYKAKGVRQRQQDTLVGFQFTKYDKKWAQGDKTMKVSLPGTFLRLIHVY